MSKRGIQNSNPRAVLSRLIDMGETELVLDLYGSNKEETINKETVADPLDNINSLIDLDKFIKTGHGCRKCKLCSERSNIVFGMGDANSNILFVGEAPGAEEDRVGMPFIGQSGKVLKKLFDEVGISERKDYYIANTVMCRPPDNRDPEKDELKNCLPYLFKQIELIKPKIICCLGKVAAQNLLGTTNNLKQLRGVVHNFNDIPVVVTYHPGYLLRNSSGRSAVVSDLKKILRILNSDKDAVKVEKHYKLITTLEELENTVEYILNNAEIIAFDVETTGLEFFCNKILGVGLSISPYSAYYIPIKYFSALEELYKSHFSDLNYFDPKVFKKLIRSKEHKNKFIKYELDDFWGDDSKKVYNLVKKLLESGIPKTAHNAKFDIKFLKYVGINVKNLRFDSMLAHYLLDENSRHSLDELSVSFDDLLDYSSIVKDIGGSGKEVAFHTVPVEILGEYCMKDCDLCLRLSYMFRDELEKKPKLFNLLRKFYIPLTDIFVDAEIQGITVDVSNTLELKESFEKEMKEISDKLNIRAGKEINIASNKQKGWLLFEKLGLPILAKTPSGNPKVDNEVLLNLRDNHKSGVAGFLLRYAFLAKMVSTYLNNFLNMRDVNNRIHSSYKLHGTETGRLSSAGPNLQNIPRDKRIKSLLVASPGRTLIVTDYSQMELRVLAWYSKDKKMLDCYEQGIDIHKLTASSIFSVPYEEVTKAQRQISKTTNFAIVYGSGAEGLMNTLNTDSKFEESGFNITQDEAQQFLNIYFKTYTGVADWISFVYEGALESGFVENVFGRRRRFPQFMDRGLSNYEQAELRRKAANSVIQGTASDICNFATIRCVNYLKENGFDKKAVFIVNVHDAVIFDVDEDFVDEIKEPIREILERTIEPVDVPMKVDLEISKTLYLD